MEDDVIHIYTDGACSGNPGPAGIGVLLIYNKYRKHLSEFIGNATNNIAELRAIKLGLETIKPKFRNSIIKVYTDSGYCHGLFTKNWNAKKNIELVIDIRSLLVSFNNIEIIKVKGHSDNINNNIADELATNAIRKKSSLCTGVS